jgi:hypothetical protein
LSGGLDDDGFGDRSMKRVLAGIVVAAGLALLLVPSEIRNTWLSGSWSQVKSVHKYKGSFFRMKVALVYKGEAQNFDVVYGCNVNYVRYKDGASTSEIGLVPSVYGRRMSDGKALIVQAPGAACKPGNPAPYNPYLLNDFMPLVIVFENAAELGFGTAYISDDAYASPTSDLKFGAASIETASREEFDEFRSNGPPNIVRRETYHADNLSDENARALGIPPIRPLDELPGLGFYCEAYARFRVSEEVAEVLRRYWPGNKPKYWEPTTSGEDMAIKTMKRPVMVARDDGDEFRDMQLFRISGSELEYGVRRRGDDILIEKPELRYLPPTFYPSYFETARHFLPRTRAEFESHIAKSESFAEPAIHMRDGAMKGRGYCFRGESLTGPQFGGPELVEPNGVRLRNLFYGKRRVATVDGEQIQLNTKYNDGLQGSMYFFEQDRYLWVIYQFGIGSLRGDV